MIRIQVGGDYICTFDYSHFLTPFPFSLSLFSSSNMTKPIVDWNSLVFIVLVADH